MRFGNKAVFAAVALTGLMFVSAAYAADANLGDCVHMSKQVASAIDAAQPGKAKDDAASLLRAGRSYCAVSMYKAGVESYSRALTVLSGKS